MKGKPVLNRGEFPRRFTVTLVGECSFCHRRDGEAYVFAGISNRSDLICGECLSVCLDVTCYYANRKERESLAAKLLQLDPKRSAKDEFIDAMLSRDFTGAAEAFRKLGFDASPEDLRDMVERERGRVCCGIGTRKGEPESCSFCDAKREEVAKLTTAPGVAICERCVDDASTEILGVLVPR